MKLQEWKRLSAALGMLLCASLGVTLALLLMEGRWREAIPLHLCSLSALAAIRPARRCLIFFGIWACPARRWRSCFPRRP